MADPTFLVTYPIPEPGMGSLRAAGRVHVPDEQPTPEELREACAPATSTSSSRNFSDRFDADLLGAAKLAGISNYAVGYDNIDIPAATANGIPVGNTPGVLTDATADLAMLLILATARRAVEADQFTRSGQFTGWKPELLLGQDVSGATLGLAGFGRIARATAHARRRVRHGRHVLLASTRRADRRRRGTRHACPTRCAKSAGHELVERSDFLSVHVPLAPSTRHLIDASAIAAMKPTAILVNTARGPIVDEAALVDLACATATSQAPDSTCTKTSPASRPALPTCRTSCFCRTSAVRRRRCGPGWQNCAQATPSPSRMALAPPHCVNPEAVKRCLSHEEPAASSKQQPLLVLGKITEILDAFSLTRPDMSLGEIQQATGLPTSTVQRLVSNMAAQGLLDRKGDRIRIGVRMSYWAATALKDLDVLAVVNSGAQRDPRQDRRDGVLLQGRAELPGLRRGRRNPSRAASRHVRGQGHSRCTSAPRHGCCWRGTPTSPSRSLPRRSNR